MNFGERLTRIRETTIFNASDLTQMLGREVQENRALTATEVAELLMIQRTYYLGYEGSDRVPRTKTLEKLATIFRVDTTEFTMEEDEPLPPGKLAELHRLRAENERLRRMVKELTAMLPE